ILPGRPRAASAHGSRVAHGSPQGPASSVRRRDDRRQNRNREWPMRLRHFYPLLGYVAPTVIIGYGVVIPTSCIAAITDLTIGFASAIVGACVTYVLGLRSVLRERGS